MQIAEKNSLRRPTPRLNPSPATRVTGGAALEDFFAGSTPDFESQGARLRLLANTRPPRATPEPDEDIDQSSDFPGREGYDSAFLGVDLGLPKLSDTLRAKAAPLLADPSKIELEYTNFSAIVHKERRLPILTAVNIDGKKLVDLPRAGGWTTDSRIAREHQLGNEAYTHNPWDRGHMVRRSDAVWGEQAEQANSDTFVYTNAALQHADLNQREWLELENHIISHARTNDQKMTVFTGPVLADDDPAFDNKGRVVPPTQIPQEFWKVAVWKDDQTGKLRGTAFVLSQKEFALEEAGGIFQNDLPADRFSVYQVPVSELESKTGLEFGDIQDVVEQRHPIDKLEAVKT